MKIKIDIDCTPKEVREFFGLPDVAPMQERLMSEVEERLQTALKQIESGELWRTWMPMASPMAGKAGMEGFEQMRRFFWPGSAPSADDDKEQS